MRVYDLEVYVYKSDLSPLGMIDNYESLIWSDRYNECGDFELKAPYTDELKMLLSIGNFIQIRDSDRTMIVEKTVLDTDVEQGSYLTATGRSLESILDRRIVYGEIVFSGGLQQAIQNLLNSTFISPSSSGVNAGRATNIMTFKTSVDSVVTSATVNSVYTNETVYDIISKECESLQIGFKIVLTNANKFEFSLYAGTDRSYNQTKVPVISFSPKMENIVSSAYTKSEQSVKNVAIVAGKEAFVDGTSEEGMCDYGACPCHNHYDYKDIWVLVGDLLKTGLNRKEVYVDGTNIESLTTKIVPTKVFVPYDSETGRSEHWENTNETHEATVYDPTYRTRLQNYAKAEILRYTDEESFEGDVEKNGSYKYPYDYQMGDIVQLENEFGNETKTYLSEIIISKDGDGINISPTFKDSIR